jgi:hypothetical protein
MYHTFGKMDYVTDYIVFDKFAYINMVKEGWFHLSMNNKISKYCFSLKKGRQLFLLIDGADDH